MESTILVYVAFGLAGILILPYATLLYFSPPAIITHDSEKKYRSHASPSNNNNNNNNPLFLTRLTDPATHDLTVVVPAYNETDRLPRMLESTLKHLESTRRSFEIIIVDDGSTDGTSATALKVASSSSGSSKYNECGGGGGGGGGGGIKVVTLEKNIGKGGAVRHGMLYAGGQRLLMADADGATRIEDLEQLWKVMDEIAPDNAPGVVVGSRAHLVKSEAVVKRSLLRNILMYGFHTVLRIFGVGHIRDTQCGFKLFSRSAARQLFPAQHLPTWIFDVELLLLAQKLDIPTAEVPVDWHEVPGSKLNVVTASMQMFRDLLIVRANHLLGRWIATPTKTKME